MVCHVRHGATTALLAVGTIALVVALIQAKHRRSAAILLVSLLSTWVQWLRCVLRMCSSRSATTGGWLMYGC